MPHTIRPSVHGPRLREMPLRVSSLPLVIFRSQTFFSAFNWCARTTLSSARASPPQLSGTSRRHQISLRTFCAPSLSPRSKLSERVVRRRRCRVLRKRFSPPSLRQQMRHSAVASLRWQLSRRRGGIPAIVAGNAPYLATDLGFFQASPGRPWDIGTIRAHDRNGMKLHQVSVSSLRLHRTSPHRYYNRHARDSGCTARSVRLGRSRR